MLTTTTTTATTQKLLATTLSGRWNSISVRCLLTPPPKKRKKKSLYADKTPFWDVLWSIPERKVALNLPEVWGTERPAVIRPHIWADEGGGWRESKGHRRRADGYLSKRIRIDCSGSAPLNKAASQVGVRPYLWNKCAFACVGGEKRTVRWCGRIGSQDVTAALVNHRKDI